MPMLVLVYKNVFGTNNIGSTPYQFKEDTKHPLMNIT